MAKAFPKTIYVAYDRPDPMDKHEVLLATTKAIEHAEFNAEKLVGRYVLDDVAVLKNTSVLGPPKRNRRAKERGR